MLVFPGSSFAVFVEYISELGYVIAVRLPAICYTWLREKK